MRIFLGLLMISFAVTAILIVPFINFLYQKKVTKKDERGEVRKNATKELEIIRRKHALKAGTPTGLGILLLGVIPVLFLLGFVLFLSPQMVHGRVSGFSAGPELAAIFVTFVGFGLIGLYDDLLKVFGFARTGFFGLRRWHKFGLQWLVAFGAAIILYKVLGINFLHLSFVTINLGWLYVPLAAFLLVTFANAFDITSGLDGLGEGLLVICLLAFWVISATQLDQVLQLLISVWVGALLAGLYFTIYPARAFLGNASGMAFGATLAMVGLLSGKIVPLLVVGGMFLIDGGSSLLQVFSKTVLKRRVFPIAPIHHWLELIGWEEPKIVTRAWLVGIVFAVTGVWLAML